MLKQINGVNREKREKVIGNCKVSVKRIVIALIVETAMTYIKHFLDM